MMRGSTTVMTVKSVAASMACDRDKLGFDVADLGGNVIFFGIESMKG